MDQSFTNWADATFSPVAEAELAEKVGNTPCPDPEGWLEMLKTILDNSADAPTLAKFREHVVDCLPCFKWYNLEYSVKRRIMEIPQHHPNHDLIVKIKELILSQSQNA